MPRHRSSSRRRTRRRGSSTRRSRRRSRSRDRTQRRKRQREKSSSDVRKNDGGKKQEGRKKAKKADKPGKGEKEEKAEKVDKVEKSEKPPEKDDKQQHTETKELAPEEKEQKPDAGKADKSEKPGKPTKADKPEKADKKPAKDKAKAKKTKDGKEKADKGGDNNDKTNSKSESKKDPAKADAKKKAKAKKDKSSSYDSSYSSSSSSSDEDEDQQQQQQYLNAMNQWAMMQGMPTAMGTSQMGMAGYAQYTGGQYPGYGAAYGYSDPYGRPYGSSMGEQVPSGCGYMQGVAGVAGVSQPFAPPAPPPPPYMPGPMTEEERLADERDKARRRLEDETRLRNEELLRKADAEKAVVAIKNAALALQNGQSDALDNLQKKLEKLVERDLPKCESHAEALKKDVNKAIQEASKRKESLRELKSMVRNGEEHIKATAQLIRQNLALEKEKDHEEMSDQLENAGLEAQGMSDRYQSFIEEHSKSLEELQSVTKGPALVDLRLIVAKIKKLGSDLTQTATNAASVVRDSKEKWSRRERAIEQSQRIQDTFALYDADEDGFLSKQEVIQYSQGEFEFTPPETCMDRLWRNLVGPGKEGIAFDSFQQMKMAIGAARVIEKERRKAQGTQEAAATLN